MEETAVWWTVQAIVSAYFVSGLTKLIRTQGRWVAWSPGLILSAMSRLDQGSMGTRRQLRKVDRQRTLVEMAWAHRRLSQAAFAGGLLVELSSPVGLVSPAVLTAVGLCILVLHQANRIMLALAFPIWQYLVFTYLVDVPRYFT
jgi:hypothetical protein